jgi:hypothetical protein
MRKDVLLALLISAVITACGQKSETAAPAAAPAPAPVAEAAPPPPPEEDIYVKTAKDAVLRVLKDPGSAQFQDVKGSVVQGDETVCGKVNAKNAMGGYVGFKMFCWTKKNGLMPLQGEM